MPVLQSRVLYGLKTNIDGNVNYLSDTEIIYPVGNALAFHNFSQRRQRLLRLPDKHEINIIAITPNRKYVATCEVGEKPTINIYDVYSLKRKKTLGIPYEAAGVTKFNCISFSHDSRCLAAVTGEPDQTMLFYAWEKGKVESSIKVGTTQNPQSIVKCITCNPGDSGVIALGGPYAFKFLTVSETVWRPYGFSKSENLLVSSMAWLNTDRILVGTYDGRILYLENGDLKNIYKMTETSVMNLKVREEYVVAASTSQTNLEVYSDDKLWQNDVRSLVAFQRGFAYGFGPGTVVVWEREGQQKLTKRHIYEVPPQVSKIVDESLYRINSISPNLSNDILVVTTGWSQLFCAKLWGPETLLDVVSSNFTIMGQHLHHGPIGDLSICAWKSVFMSCGEEDRSVRIWDYETEKLLLAKQYNEDVYCVALHPTGLFCLIGFSDKLRFMSILMDDFVTVQEIAVRNCRTVSFSHGGHLFAAVNGNIIQVYTTVGFTSRFLLKGHTGRIKNVVWSQNDMRLVSIGSEGALYEWDMSNGKRNYEVYLKGISMNDVALTADGTMTYCISSDSKIREIKESSIIRELMINEKKMLVLIMSKDDFGMFIGSPDGLIIFVRYPLQEPLDTTEFHVHCADITSMCLSFDEKVLVSAAQDGTMCFWRVAKSEGLAMEFTRTNEILIGQGDLEDKVEKIEELTVRMRELETEHAYKMRQTEVHHNEKIREIHQGYCEAIEELRIKIETLQEERTNELNKINVDIARMKKTHDEAIRVMEMNYDAKLIEEYDKYRDFEERNNLMRQEYEIEIEKLQEQRIQELEELKKNYEAQLHSKNLELEESHEEIAHQAIVHEELKKQIEDDADREIVALRTSYEAKLNEESRTILKLRGEAGVLRNKFFATRKDIEDLKRQLDTQHSQQTQTRKVTHDLEKDVMDLKKEITERDVTIQDKEKRIYDLKRDNQELEKFKFVLNYKIRELKSQVEPRDHEIKELRDKMSDMETELINLHKINVSSELQLQELREKLRGAKRGSEIETAKNRRLQGLLRKIRVDLSMAVELIQDPNSLKNAVMQLHQRYSADPSFSRNRDEDLRVQCEFSKQRDQLERTVESLRKQVFRDMSEDGKKEGDKMMHENVELIVELNALREELKKSRKHILDMETLLGLRAIDLTPQEAKRKLSDACHGKDEIERMYKQKMHDCEKMVATLQDDIKRLLNKDMAPQEK
ncbi:cilia- and flagella-associated protein 57 [Venturia canescens]|uniref:cilia- and flagella-associated protein 57 n=1 Tax=Venturia canescens TaxID=32260 RepID=UPI001C9BE66C|nr:cilia- and flagella-associated protein 57 [Venturia canescens]